jgi:hypothetical protein
MSIEDAYADEYEHEGEHGHKNEYRGKYRYTEKIDMSMWIRMRWSMNIKDAH